MNPLALNYKNLLVKQIPKNLLVNFRNVSGCMAPLGKGKFVSMWENRQCEPSVATCPQVRFDDLYYKPSDKKKRKYQQTWVECPKRLIKPTVICEFPKDKYPPMEKRPRAARPDTAKCMSSGQNADLMPCNRQKEMTKNNNCLKITLPGCRSVRGDIKCKLVRKPADCKPAPTPYPSFSECTRPKLKTKRTGECECMKIRSMCAVWTTLRQKAIL